MLKEGTEIWSDILDLSTADDVRHYLDDNFRFITIDHYHDEIFTNMPGHRLENPDFLRFYARMMMMAAEYGYPDGSGYLLRKLSFGFLDDDYSDPKNILAAGTSLANTNVQAYRQKMISLDYQRQRTGPLTEEQQQFIWASYAKPDDAGNVNLPLIMANNSAAIVKIQRPAEHLAVYKPDIRFLRQASAINFYREDAIYMPRDEFMAQVMPAVHQAYDPYIRVASIFLDPRNQWPHDPY